MKKILYLYFILFLTCSCGEAIVSGKSRNVDLTSKAVNDLTRENEDLKVKVDDLLARMLKLSKIIDDHQVKLDYLADKLHSLEVRAEGDKISSFSQASNNKRKTNKLNSSILKGDKKNLEKNNSNKASSDIDPYLQYEIALKMYRKGNYQETIIKLKEFLTLFPKNNRASNARYWIGESYFSMKDYKNSIRNFQIVLQKYPLSGKIPDAMLKMGMCFLKLSYKDKAAIEFQQVIDQFPKTQAAKLSREKLNQLN